jgi:hypothetical protein
MTGEVAIKNTPNNEARMRRMDEALGTWRSEGKYGPDRNVAHAATAGEFWSGTLSVTAASSKFR